MTNLNDRAVSTAVSHAITIGITSIMLTGLMVGAGQMVDDQREYVVERGLEDVSSAVVSNLMRMDQFNTTGTSVSFTTDEFIDASTGQSVFTLDTGYGFGFSEGNENENYRLGVAHGMNREVICIV